MKTSSFKSARAIMAATGIDPQVVTNPVNNESTFTFCYDDDDPNGIEHAAHLYERGDLGDLNAAAFDAAERRLKELIREAKQRAHELVTSDPDLEYAVIISRQRQRIADAARAAAESPHARAMELRRSAQQK